MWPFDQNNQQVYQQYAQAYDNGNYYGVDPNQAFGHVQQFMQGAPLDMQQQVYQQHFAQMPYDQRLLVAQQMPAHYGVNPNDPWSMSQGLARLGQEQPHMLQKIFSHPLLTASALGLAGLVAKHMLSQHQNNQGYAYNQGGYQQDPYMRQELNQERREEQHLHRELQEERRELRAEERREERLEENLEHRHHHRDRDDY